MLDGSHAGGASWINRLLSVFLSIVLVTQCGVPTTAFASESGSAGGMLTIAAEQDEEITSDFTGSSVAVQAATGIFTVSFDSAGGTEVAPQQVESGSAAEEPEAPTREHYAFQGWYVDEGCTEAYDFGAPVTSDLTLHAGWDSESGWWAHFEAGCDDAAGATESEPVYYTNAAGSISGFDFPECGFERDGYEFAGWVVSDGSSSKIYQPGDTYTVKTKYWTADRTFAATWTKVKTWDLSHTLVFDTNGGSFSDGSATLTQVLELSVATTMGGIVVLDWTTPSADEVSREGYELLGWSEDPDATEADYIPACAGYYDEDFDTRTFYAVWQAEEAEAFTVSFDSAGGTEVAPQQVESGSAAARPDDPTREHYAFQGWYVDEGCTEAYDFGAPVTSDLTLHAKWEAVPVELTSSMLAVDTSDELWAGEAVTKDITVTDGGTVLVEGT